MTQALAQARKALEAARLFIAAEYADASAEMYGEWLASEARPVFAEICRALADIEMAGDVGHGPYGYLLKPIGLNEEHWTLSSEQSEYPDEVVSVPLFALGDPALAAIDAALEGGAVPKVREPVRWPQPGDNMRFLAENGYDHELAAAKAIFQKNDIVTVRRCDVGSYSHTVWFEGHERGFNGVMFKLLPSPPTGA